MILVLSGHWKHFHATLSRDTKISELQCIDCCRSGFSRLWHWLPRHHLFLQVGKVSSDLYAWCSPESFMQGHLCGRIFILFSCSTCGCHTWCGRCHSAKSAYLGLASGQILYSGSWLGNDPPRFCTLGLWFSYLVVVMIYLLKALPGRSNVSSS